MAETQTLRIDAGDRVREVVVRCVARERWRCPDGHHEMTPMATARAWAYRNCVMGAVLAPGEPTRAELAAQLATATASVQQLRADVELATAQRDAETCRADNTEGERDVLRAQQAPLLDAHDALVAAARAAGWRDAGATGPELVAWVRRGEREACAVRLERVADGEAGMAECDRRDGDMRHAEIFSGRARVLRQMARRTREGGE